MASLNGTAPVSPNAETATRRAGRPVTSGAVTGAGGGATVVRTVPRLVRAAP